RSRKMDSRKRKLVYSRTALDVRGFSIPSGGDRRHLWAVSGVEDNDETIISLAATCFNSTVWLGRCTAAEVVKQLMGEVGAVLTQQQLLEYIQEALDNCNHQPSFTDHQQQLQPPPVQPVQPTQQTQARYGCSQPPQRQQPVELQLQQPALALTLPVRQPSNGQGTAAGGTGAVCGDEEGDGSSGAFVTVLLPPSRFGGCEVTVRLPCRGDMVQVSGKEAENACLTLVANLIRQSDEQREEMDTLVSELTRVVEENRWLHSQLEAHTSGGGTNGAEGRTVREQYGLAGAPPPPPAAAAKRLRSAASVGLGMQMTSAPDGAVTGGAPPPLSSQLPAPSAGGPWIPHGSQGTGGFGAKRFESQCCGAVPMAGLLSGVMDGGMGAKGAQAQAAAGESTLGYAAMTTAATSAGGFGATLGVTAPQREAGALLPSSLVREGTDVGAVTGATSAGGVVHEGNAEPSTGVSEPRSHQQLEPAGGGGHGVRQGTEELLPARRDPSRVGVTIRKTGPMGRWASRGGRGLPRH
ncbi:hypothetical protein VaNZ11_007152, partial [Volvox africanus]